MDYEKLKKKWKIQKQERKIRSAQVKSKVLLKGVPVFKKFNIHRVILFGSILDETCETDSDLDLLVSLLPGDRYWAFRHELEQALELPVDVYTQDDDPAFIRKIGERGQVIYEI